MESSREIPGNSDHAAHLKLRPWCVTTISGQKSLIADSGLKSAEKPATLISEVHRTATKPLAMQAASQSI